jgi:hypothetical protein
LRDLRRGDGFFSFIEVTGIIALYEVL